MARATGCSIGTALFFIFILLKKIKIGSFPGPRRRTPAWPSIPLVPGFHSESWDGTGQCSSILTASDFYREDGFVAHRWLQEIPEEQLAPRDPEIASCSGNKIVCEQQVLSMHARHNGEEPDSRRMEWRDGRSNMVKSKSRIPTVRVGRLAGGLGRYRQKGKTVSHLGPSPRARYGNRKRMKIK